jgi:hypothetical protein
MADVVEGSEDEARIERIAGQVLEMCNNFPAPGVPI